MTDSILIRGGRVHNGERFVGAADVLIRNGRIEAVGDLGTVSDAVETVDAVGCIVCPGFIELHDMQYELDKLDGNDAVNLTAQGVTTCLIGNCGQSGTFGSDGGFIRGNDVLRSSRLGINVSRLLGHNTLRQHVVAEPTQPSTPAEVDRMERIVQGALDDGAAGISTGLMYAPGSFSDRAELVRLVAAAASGDRLYATHMRDEGDDLRNSVHEALDVARDANAPLIISHFKACGPRNWGTARALIPSIEDRRRQQEVWVTYYPYLAPSTFLRAAIPPELLQAAGGLDGLKFNAVDERIVEDKGLQTLCPGGWADVAVVTSQVEGAVGKSIAELATGGSGCRTVLDLLEQDPATRVVFHNVCDEAEMLDIAALPFAIVCSDGYVYPTGSTEATHPRNYGAFATMLNRLVSEGDAAVEEFVRKTTSLPAQVLRLQDRGRLLAGRVADVCVIRPEAVAARATFAEPYRLAEGVVATIVNGAVAFRAGGATGSFAGEFLEAAGST